MSRRNPPRAGVGLAVALALVVALAGALPRPAAAAPGKEMARIQETGSFQRAWGWLVQVGIAHNPVNSLLRLWGAAGPEIDPDGKGTAAGTGTSPCGGAVCPDTGPLIDPDGNH